MIHRRSCFSLRSTAFLAAISWLVLTVILITVLTACSGNSKKWNPDDYTVKSGDTIYAIAWKYELDPEAFVAWNGIGASNIIKPGQRLHTRKPYNFDANQRAEKARDVAYVPQAVAKSKRSTSTPVKRPVDRQTVVSQQKWIRARKGDTLYGLSKRSGVSVERLVKLNQLKKPYTIQPGQTIFLKPLNTPVRTVTKNKTVATNRKKEPSSRSQKNYWPKTVRWQRPAKGKVIKKFSRQRNDAKGIDIAGKQGSHIVASADGKVVYSGNGLISYGNLIIIKHNKTYLSAYAYNRKLLVKEGDVVKAGQKIAEMGRKDKLSPRLHFEIRKNGKPVDPLKYLPR